MTAAQLNQTLKLASAVLFVIAAIYIIQGLTVAHTAAQQMQTGAQQLQQQISAAQRQASVGTAQLQRALQPAEGSSCTPTGGGHGVIVIEGPSAANPGHGDCVPQ